MFSQLSSYVMDQSEYFITGIIIGDKSKSEWKSKLKALFSCWYNKHPLIGNGSAIIKHDRAMHGDYLVPLPQNH